MTQPTSAADAAGFDVVNAGSGVTTAHAELSLRQLQTGTAAGNVVGDLNLPIPASLQPTLVGLTFSVNSTMNGNPFTRMPTSCTPAAPSSVTVTYAGPVNTTTNASPDVDVSATCNGLPYAPQLAAAAQKDSGDNGVAIQTAITQTVGEAANRNTSLFTPPATLTPNTAAIGLQCPTFPNVTGCTKVGTATLNTPLVPFPVPGAVYLAGTSPLAPKLAIGFPPPFNLALVGSINLATNAVTFANAAGGFDIADVPLTKLAVNLNGGPQSLFTSSCAQPSNTLNSGFVAQNGKTASSPAALTIANCPTGPSVGSKSLSGIGKGKPKLKFTVNAATGGPKLSSLKVKLPGGLKFAHKVKKGLKVSGGKLKSAKVKGGQLVITLKSAVSSVTVTLSKPALKETKALQKKAKKKKVKSLTVRVTPTDAKGTATPLTLTFNNPK